MIDLTGAEPATSPSTRLVGAAALAYAATVLAQNAMFVGPVARLVGLGDGTGAPTYGDPLETVLAYHVSNRDAVAVAVGLEALALPFLLVFLTGLHGLIQRRGPTGATWSRLAVVAGATLSALFAVVIATHIAVVLTAQGQAEPSPALALAWHLHAAAFAMSLPALGMTFLGAALATQVSGLTRRWQHVLGVTGGLALVAAGTASLAIADGSPLIAVGVSGLAAWVLWVAATGLRLALEPRPTTR